MQLTRKSTKWNRRGAAAVETAICLPIIFLFVFAIMEFGHALMGHHLLANAARLAARDAMLDNSTNAAVELTAKEFCVDSFGVELDDVNVTLDLEAEDGGSVENNSLANASAGDRCSVTVSISYDTVSLFPASFFGGKQISKAYTLEHE